MVISFAFSGCNSGNINSVSQNNEVLSSVGLADEETSIDVSDIIENLPKNADEYYNRYTEIVSVAKADKVNQLTGKEIVQTLANRGFDTDTVITNYDKDGNYSEEDIIITDELSEKYPLCKMMYLSEAELLWTIYVINEAVFAWPVLYNLESERETALVISETDTIISYDYTNNQYYETKPHEDSITVSKVDKINKEILDTFTIEELNNL